MPLDLQSQSVLRVPLAWPYNPRTTTLVKDARRKNVIYEKMTAQNGYYAMKRPGVEEAYDSGAVSTGQGLTYFNGQLLGVFEDTLVTLASSGPTGTDGTDFRNYNAAWPGRLGHAAVTFNGRIFIFGGVGPASTYANIWSSMDGVSWTPSASAAPWGSRQYMGAVVLGDTMYIMGGYDTDTATYKNDVWSSKDGTKWEQVTAAAAWLPRNRFGLVATNSGMMLVGGVNTTFPAFDDVWYSADGATWTRQGGSFGWGTRQGHSLLYFNNSVYLIGGVNSAGTLQNDVWFTFDGSQWTQASAAAFASARSLMGAVVYAGQMWVLGGSTGGGAVDDVYSSLTGSGAWTLVDSTGNFGNIYGAPAVVFQSPTQAPFAGLPYRYPTIFYMGGYTGVTETNQVSVGYLNATPGTNLGISLNSGAVADQPYQFASYNIGNQLLVKNNYGLNIFDSGSLNFVFDRGYPVQTVAGVVVLGGFVYVMDKSGLIYACAINNPYYWPALNVIGADYEDDFGVCLAKYLNYVVAFGEYTTQVFYDAGLQFGSPLQPYLNANIRIGCAAAETVVEMDNTLVWVSQTRQLHRQVVVFDGVSPRPISTPEIEKLINSDNATADGSFVSPKAYQVSTQGHLFYVLYSDDANCAFSVAFDFTTQQWFDWTDASGASPLKYASFASTRELNGNFLQGKEDGLVYRVAGDLYDDDGTPFPVYIRTQKYDNGNNRMKFFGRLDVIGDQSGAAPEISYTDDDYQSYSTPRAVDMTSARPALFRNGCARRRAWVYEQEDSEPMRVEALEQTIEQGT
jgi:hypothetical protein